MALKIDVRGDVKAILRDLNAIQRRHVPRATVRALNRTMSWVRTQAKRKLAAHLQIQAGVASKQMRITKAKLGYRSALLSLNTRPISAIRLKARETATGVRAGRHAFPGAFIATGVGGHRHVFKRTGERRVMKAGRRQGKVAEVIDAVKIPVEPMGTALVGTIVTERSGARFVQEFQRDLAYRLRRG